MANEFGITVDEVVGQNDFNITVEDIRNAPIDPGDSSVLDRALLVAKRNATVQGLQQAPRSLKSGAAGSASGLLNTGANLFSMLQDASDWLNEKSGLPKRGAFQRLEQHLRGQSNIFARIATENAAEDPSLSQRLFQIGGATPVELSQAAAAVAVGGPVIGFAGLGALSAQDQGLQQAGIEAAKGATIGKVFKFTEGLGRGTRFGTVGGTTSGLESATGATVDDSLLSGLVTGGLAAAGAPRLPRAGPTPRGPFVETEKPFGDLKVKRVEGERPAVDTEGIISVTERTVRVAEEFLGKDYSDIQLPDKSIRPNLERIRGPEDFKQAQASINEIIKDSIDESRRGQITLEQTRQMADDLGITVTELMKRRKGEAFNAEELVASRVLHQSIASEFKRLSDLVKTGEANDIQKAEFLRVMSLYDASANQVLGATAEAGRALSAMRVEVGPKSAEVKRIRDMIQDFSGRDGKELEVFADMVSAAQTPGELMKIAKAAKTATTGDKLLELWINSLLSGPQTHAVNLLSNTAVAMWAVPDAAVSATFGAVRGAKARLRGEPIPDRVFFNEVPARAFALAMGARDGLRLMGRVLRTGEPLDPNTKLEVQRHRAITGLKGDVIRLPGRFLMAGDELFKAVGYRQEVYARSVRQATREGKTGREFFRRADEIARNPSDEIRSAALANARFQTFTNEMGAIGKSVQSLRNSHPAVALIIPFVRTPTNIFKFSAKNTPAGIAFREVRDQIRKGGAARDEALGRMAFGGAVAMWVMHEAAAGRVTGSGPTDPELRAAWFADGHRPYSVRLQNEDGSEDYHSYARLEPLGTILGVAADFAEIAGHIEDPEQREELAAAIQMSIMRNIGNKTFLSGLTGAAMALSDPDRFGPRWWQRLAGTVVPTGISQVNRAGIPGLVEKDPVLREVRTAIDQIKSRIPGYSNTLKPRRDIFGEPIFLDGGLGPDLVSPIYTHRRQWDKVRSEVVRLKVRVQRPERKLDGVELTPDEWDQFQAMTGRTAKQNLDQMMSSPVWEFTPDSIQKHLIRKTFEESRAMARQVIKTRMLLENPQRALEPKRKEIEEFIR